MRDTRQMEQTRKTIFILLGFLLILIVVALLIVFNGFNKEETPVSMEATSAIQVTPEATAEPIEETTPNITAEPTEDITPTPTMEPTPTPELVIRTAPLYRPSNTAILGLSGALNLADVEEMWGAPDSSEREALESISGEVITYYYDFGCVKFYLAEGRALETAGVYQVTIKSSEYEGAVGIQTGDSIMTVADEIGLDFDYINHAQEIIYDGDKQVGRITYVNGVPDGIWLYDADDDLTGVYILLSGGYVTEHGVYTQLN